MSVALGLTQQTPVAHLNFKLLYSILGAACVHALKACQHGEQSTAVVSENATLACNLAPCVQALDDDEMMRQYAALLLRQDTAREEALLALQARTAMRAEVAGLEVGLTKV